MNHYATPPTHALGDQARLQRITDEFRAGYELLESIGKAVTYFGSHITREGGGRSIGFNLILETEQKNPYVQESVSFYYLFVRKVILASAGHAYVFFPGGFGTLDEFFEISTLIHTHKLHEDVPAILIGHEYWDPLLEWFRRVAIERYHAFDEVDLSMWKIVESADEAYQELRANALPVRLYY